MSRIILSILLLTMLVGCGHKEFTQGKYDDMSQDRLLDDKFNESDMRMIADSMIASLTGSPPMIDTLLDWVSLLVRWTQVIAGIAWIGPSFLFIALDDGPQANPRLDQRVKGEAWQVQADPEILGGIGFHAGAPYLVQVGGLRHLDLRFCPIGAGLLFEPDGLSDRHFGDEHRCGGRGGIAGDRPVRLRPVVPLLVRP